MAWYCTYITVQCVLVLSYRLTGRLRDHHTTTSRYLITRYFHCSVSALRPSPRRPNHLWSFHLFFPLHSLRKATSPSIYERRIQHLDCFFFLNPRRVASCSRRLSRSLRRYFAFAPTRPARRPSTTVHPIHPPRSTPACHTASGSRSHEIRCGFGSKSRPPTPASTPNFGQPAALSRSGSSRRLISATDSRTLTCLFLSISTRIPVASLDAPRFLPWP